MPSSYVIKSSPSSTLLDELVLRHEYAITLSGNEWVGEWHAIRWTDAYSLATRITQLSAEVTLRPPGDFWVSPFICANDGKTKVGVRVLYRGTQLLTQSVLAERSAAVSLFLRAISTDGLLENEELPFTETISDHIRDVVETVSKEFLESSDGRRCGVPVVANVASASEPLVIEKFAHRAPIAIHGDTEIVVGVLDAAGRSKRTCSILSIDGTWHHTKFCVETHSEVLKSILWSEIPRTFEVATVLDAKGRVGRIITEVGDPVPDQLPVLEGG